MLMIGLCLQPRYPPAVIPAEAGIQFRLFEEKHLDSRLHGNDGEGIVVS
jgi:hypothetical protein